MSMFDICILTASNPGQAEIFRRLIHKRKDRGLYPREIEFYVFSDPEAGRIGSGGGTIWALRKILEEYGEPALASEDFFRKHRILIVHAGGESRRLPCYAPEGKLFAPIPVSSSSVIPPVILDVLLNQYCKYPWNTGETIIVSGDVVVDFDTSGFVRPNGDIVGFAKPASLEQGSRHGVYRFDRYKQSVVDYYQKQSAGFLREFALLEGTDECALDIGVVSITSTFVKTLVDLSMDKFGQGANLYEDLHNGSVYIDLYLELLSANLKGLALEEYQGRLRNEGSLSDEQLKTIFNRFHPYTLTAVVTRSSSFFHFGSLNEFPESCRNIVQKMLTPFYSKDTEELIPQCTNDLIFFNSINSNIDRNLHHGVFAENLRQAQIMELEGNNVLTGLTNLTLPYRIPPNICIEERIIGDDAVRLIYSTKDTFQKRKNIDSVKYCGIPLSRWLSERDLELNDIWDSVDDLYDLHMATIAGPWDADFIKGFLFAPEDPLSWKKQFLQSVRYSINTSNELCSAEEREQLRENARAAVLRKKILAGEGFINIAKEEVPIIFKEQDAERLLEVYRKTDDPLLKVYRKELLKKFYTDENDFVYRITFYTPDAGFIAGSKLNYIRCVKTDQIVWARSPVRLDLAGGWSDTPPYTNREGGKVVNVSVNLNGQPPVQVFVRPLQEAQIILHSIDMGVTEKVSSIGTLTDYTDPSNPFALVKAALCLIFRIGNHSESKRKGHIELHTLLGDVGGGLELTLLCAVPKGSGLGTSSILAGTILAGLHRFFGVDVNKDELFLQVLEVEQMLTTGGGWQDQIGGIVGGVKYIETRPGLKPIPVIQQLDTAMFEQAEYIRCMTIYYTGITRLAKNILQDVVDMSNGKSPAYLYTLRYIKELAEQAKEAISLRDYKLLAKTIEDSWNANKLIHQSTTNEEIEKILKTVSLYYTGMKLFGAGGGGFGMFMSPDEKSADKLRSILCSEIGNDRSRILDMTLNRDGLVVTVS